MVENENKKIKIRRICIMMLARRNNSMNWLNNWFDDDFFNTDWMPSFQVNTTEPAVNVKEDDKAVYHGGCCTGTEEGVCTCGCQ